MTAGKAFVVSAVGVVHRREGGPWRTIRGAAESFDQAYRTGIFPDRSEEGRQEACFADPPMIRSFFESGGFASVAIIAVQGIATDKEAGLF